MKTFMLILMYFCQELTHFLLVYFLLAEMCNIDMLNKETEKSNHPVCLGKVKGRNVAFYHKTEEVSNQQQL